MKLYIGVDLGTSALKLLLMDGEGGIRNVVSREYPLEFPQPGWSQQRPEDWAQALMEGIPELLTGFDGLQVAGIGAGGQMHGLVVLDENDKVIKKEIDVLDWSPEMAEKEGYDHFMIKEIIEQSKAVKNTLGQRANIQRIIDEIGDVKRICFVACGTSYHASMTGKYLLESLAGIQTEVLLASEKPITLPPSSSIAASKESLVLVLGSKNNVARILPSHLCAYFSLLS